jgi:uncharacterized membrane protein SirB2
MIEYYPQIKQAHLLCITASGALFLLRGCGIFWSRRSGKRIAIAGQQMDTPWPMSALVRYLSYSIDSALLTTALMLIAILPSATFANGWLASKLLLVVLYIVLGSYAFKRAQTRSVQLICFVAALLVFGSVILIARTHHPVAGLWQ